MAEEHSGHGRRAEPDQAAAHGRGAQAGHDAHGGHGAQAGHDAHAGHSVAMFRDRLWLSLLLTVPVLVLSETIQSWLGFRPSSFPGDDLVAPVAASLVFLYGGFPFLVGATRELRRRRPGMMLLIALALTVAFVASVLSTAGIVDVEFWWELALLVDVMLLGHWLEMRAVGQASGALDALAALLPDEAERIGDGSVQAVPIHELAIGDIVLVRSGGRVPADGVVVEGDADIDESMITGESKPVPRGAGDRVVAGTIATDSALRVRVDAIGEETALAGIQRLVAEAQASQSRAQALADRAAALLFYLAVGAGLLTLVVWSALGRPGPAVERTITVLVIACPHALGLAIPLVIAISTSVSARAGILVNDRLALERMRLVDTVVFDKTGTLTVGRPAVTAVAPDDRADEVLALAAAVEADSEHPVARAIVDAARQRGVDAPPASGFRSMTGRGVRAAVGGADVAVGGPGLVRDLGLTWPTALLPTVQRWRSRGASVLAVVRDGVLEGGLALEDEIRPESRQAVEALRRAGLRPVMITGDAREVADAVAADLEIDRFDAEVLPERKGTVVAELQQEGRRVAMVGDGVNDAPALARADVGIAIGAGTDVAIESAGVVLATDDPRAIVGIVKLSRASYAKMLQNLLWATGYNVIAIPLAAGVLAWAGVVLPPAVGAIAMSLSTVVVAANALLLRRLDLRPGHDRAIPAGTP
jgi:Cu2+-exporting ATPase